MNRCMPRGAATATIALAALAVLVPFSSQPAAAQGFVREAPKDVVPGKLTVTLPPEVQLDGKTDRLSPGARIRDSNNMQVLSGQLAGKTVPIVYRRDTSGLIHEAWILTDDEYARLTKTGVSQGTATFLDALATIFGMRR